MHKYPSGYRANAFGGLRLGPVWPSAFPGPTPTIRGGSEFAAAFITAVLRESSIEVVRHHAGVMSNLARSQSAQTLSG